MHSTSPMTGAALPHKHLVPAISLRQLIVEFSGAGPDGSGPTIAAGGGRGGGGVGMSGRNVSTFSFVLPPSLGSPSLSPVIPHGQGIGNECVGTIYLPLLSTLLPA